MKHTILRAALLLALLPSLPAAPSAEEAAYLEREIVVPTEKEILLEEFGYITTLTGDNLSIRVTSRGDGKLLSRERFAAYHGALSTALIFDVARNIKAELGDLLVVYKAPKPDKPVTIAIDLRMDAKGVAYKAVTSSYETSNELRWEQLFDPSTR